MKTNCPPGAEQRTNTQIAKCDVPWVTSSFYPICWYRISHEMTSEVKRSWWVAKSVWFHSGNHLRDLSHTHSFSQVTLPHPFIQSSTSEKPNQPSSLAFYIPGDRVMA